MAAISLPFLPMTRKEMTALGWDELDILLITGDAYVDHPSFGIALIGRWLAAHGFRTGIIAQPPWEHPAASRDILNSMGRPRLFTGISAGAIDSMLAHYTAFRKKRHDDAYTPGGQHGARPNRATIVYTGIVRQAFPEMPIVLGGIEASLRRTVHYDFWTDAIRKPLLFDSKADILVYGMGERSLLAIANAAQARMDQQTTALKRDQFIEACHRIPGVAFLAGKHALTPLLQAYEQTQQPTEQLPSYEDILATPSQLIKATIQLEQHVHHGLTVLLQPTGDRTLVVNPPSAPLSTAEMDTLYALPFSRRPHPSYSQTIPAWEMIRTSITTHRGCGGGCSFCSLALHQGRSIASRSKHSIIAEAASIAKGSDESSKPPAWAASISDVGGPSANMWQATCTRGDVHCKRASCMHPTLCRFFSVNQQQGVQLLKEIARLPGIKHVRVASGVRFDLALQDHAALFAYTSEFTGGQLKVAPEHCDDAVLTLMRKPSLPIFEQFLDVFAAYSQKAGKQQYTIPYLMSAFPGCTTEHMKVLQAWLRKKHWQPQQVQCFIPTPGTVATAMYYAEQTPDGNALYVAKSDKERLQQHHMLFTESRSSSKQTMPRNRSQTPRSGTPQSGQKQSHTKNNLQRTKKKK